MQIKVGNHMVEFNEPSVVQAAGMVKALAQTQEGGVGPGDRAAIVKLMQAERELLRFIGTNRDVRRSVAKAAIGDVAAADVDLPALERALTAARDKMPEGPAKALLQTYADFNDLRDFHAGLVASMRIDGRPLQM